MGQLLTTAISYRLFATPSLDMKMGPHTHVHAEGGRHRAALCDASITETGLSTWLMVSKHILTICVTTCFKCYGIYNQ